MRTDPLPYLGTGLGYRVELDAFMAEHPGLVDFVELMPEHVLDASPTDGERVLRRAMQRPVVTHSVSASVGSADGPDAAFLRGMRDVTRRAGAPWASDHLCFTRIADRYVGELVPLPYTQESLDVVARNVRAAQQILGVPFALENVTRYFSYAEDEYSEPAFLRKLTQMTGCHLLLDVTNVWNNAQNLGVDAEEYLLRFPLERVIHIHLGGVHDDPDGGILDTHAGAVPEPVWDMLARILPRAPVKALVIERDGEFGEHEQLAGELRRARALMEAHA